MAKINEICEKKNANGLKKKISTKMQSELDKIQILLNETIKNYFPIWKIIPKKILWKKTNIPPIYLFLNKIGTRYVTKLKKLDEQHPLIGKIFAEKKINGGNPFPQ